MHLLQGSNEVTEPVASAGAAVVPVLVFGENDVWHAHQVKEGMLHSIQEAVKRCAVDTLAEICFLLSISCFIITSTSCTFCKVVCLSAKFVATSLQLHCCCPQLLCAASLNSKLDKVLCSLQGGVMFGATCRATGFTVPLAHGRGFFYGPVGLLPFREPINVVVGGPLQVEQYNGTSSTRVLACCNYTYCIAVCWHQALAK